MALIAWGTTYDLRMTAVSGGLYLAELIHTTREPPCSHVRSSFSYLLNLVLHRVPSQRDIDFTQMAVGSGV
jgi:hypothetical protein